MKKYRYEILEDLQGECEILSLDDSIVLTDLVLKKNSVEVAIFLLNIINKENALQHNLEQYIELYKKSREEIKILKAENEDLNNQLANLSEEFEIEETNNYED